MHDDRETYRKALDDFHRLRGKAAMARFWAGMSGKSLDLLPFQEVSSKLRAVSQKDLGLQEVPLKNIIGSVNRNEDFDRYFRPLNSDTETRWANVKTAMVSPYSQGIPPVSLYKIGDAYFALDGNHRISIAKEMGMESIEAYVTEVKTTVPLSSSFTLEELVEKAALADFLIDTHLDRILPDVDLSLKHYENYPLLKEHIMVHQYYMGIEQNHEVSFEEAALDWYDKVYWPVVQIIEETGLDAEFPDLTVTDLYLWVLDQQAVLKEEFGTEFKAENVVDFVADKEGIQTKISSDSVNEDMEKQIEAVSIGHNESLFRDILVAISHSDSEGLAQEQAMMMNRSGGNNIIGIHVKTENDLESEEVEKVLEDTFYRRLNEHGLQGRFILAKGDVSTALGKYALLGDVLVAKISYPPGGSLFDRLSSGLISLLQNSRRPLMFVKDVAKAVSQILLVLDEGEKSREAFYIAAYYTARYQCKLYLAKANDDNEEIDALHDFAVDYLHSLSLPFEEISTPGAQLMENLPELIEKNQISTVMIGGYKSGGLLGRLFSSSVDQILELSSVPVLVCQ